jgi:L-threonylcarbamoyladenylate synthase
LSKVLKKRIAYICIEMITNTGTDSKTAIALLKKGEVVAIPTETVYGLAANGLDENAIKKIFEAKKRPITNPLILHFPDLKSINPYVTDFPAELKNLAAIFWPGPLTILLEKSDLVPDIITAGQKRVAVRVPAHSKTLELLKMLEFPLAAPSANPYGMISPTKAEHVLKQLTGKIPYVLDGGECKNGLESTIIGIENNELVIYRLGSISIEQIEETIGKTVLIKTHAETIPVTSGMVKHHYAPSTPLFFIEEKLELEESDNDGFIFFKEDFICVTEKIILSPSGNLEEAAQKLYDALHLMDQKKFNRIFIEKFPEFGLGRSINDRLNRATAKFEK